MYYHCSYCWSIRFSRISRLIHPVPGSFNSLSKSTAGSSSRVYDNVLDRASRDTQILAQVEKGKRQIRARLYVLYSSRVDKVNICMYMQYY